MTPTISADQLREAVKNVLVITFDACGAKHLGCYGYFRPTSPNVDKLAQEGVLFSQFGAQYPSTPMNFRSIMWSKYLAMNDDWAKTPNVCPTGTRSLAEHFEAAGYQTAAFTGNSFFSPRFGHDAGWDLMSHEWDQEEMGHSRAPTISGNTRAWLRENAAGDDAKPFFVWSHFFEPHNPYHCCPPWDHMFTQDYPDCPGDQHQTELPCIFHNEANRLPADDKTRHVEAAFDGSIAYGDHHIGKLIEEMRALDILENTMVVVTGDHGEGWGEHGRYIHNNCIYDEEMRVPMIVRLPQSLGLGGTVRDAVHESVDILPTLVDVIGNLNDEVRADTDGVSMLPVVTGEADEVKPYIYGRAGQESQHTKASPLHVYSIRNRTHKLVWDALRDAKELYHMPKDIDEQTNIYNPACPISQALEAELKRWMEERRRIDDA